MREILKNPKQCSVRKIEAEQLKDCSNMESMKQAMKLNEQMRYLFHESSFVFYLPTVNLRPVHEDNTLMMRTILHLSNR